MTERTSCSWNTHFSLLRELADVPIILIGESAIYLWSQHYGLNSKADIGTPTLQLYANPADIKAADSRLQHHPHTTTISKIDVDAPLPTHIGSIVVNTMSGSVTIDFIGHVEGVQLSDIRLQALPYELEGPEKTMLLLMHPMMCLDHWITQLAMSHKDKNPYLIRCASISIDIARCYIEHCVDQKDIAVAMEAMQRVLILANSDAGQRAWHMHGVDVSAAVPALTLLADNCQ